MKETEKEAWERVLRQFVNKIAAELNPSNDTMQAIRLIRKKLPEILLLQHKRTIQAVKSRVWETMRECNQCGRTGMNKFGECKCSYEIPSLEWQKMDRLLDEVDKALDLGGDGNV